MTPYKYETRSMRALAALRMVWASGGLDGGGDVGNDVVVREDGKLRGGTRGPRRTAYVAHVFSFHVLEQILVRVSV
jgi:hypothetical protein